MPRRQYWADILVSAQAIPFMLDDIVTIVKISRLIYFLQTSLYAIFYFTLVIDAYRDARFL